VVETKPKERIAPVRGLHLTPGFAALFLSLVLQACLQGGSNREHCHGMKMIESTKLLTRGDRNFELSTVPEDSAFTDGLCSVQFQLSFGFDKDSLQALARPAGPFAMPLTGLQEPTLFFMNDTVLPFDGWHTYLPPYLAAGFDSTHFYLSVFPEPKGPTRRGVYSIRTSLSSSVLGGDSSVLVKARIRYQNGTY
jgi:hypothetical protein